MAALPDTRARSGAVLLAGGLAAAFLATQDRPDVAIPVVRRRDHVRQLRAGRARRRRQLAVHRRERPQGPAAVLAGCRADQRRDRSRDRDAAAGGGRYGARRDLRRPAHAPSLRAARRLPDGGADRARPVLPGDRVGGHLRRHGNRAGRRSRAGLDPAGPQSHALPRPGARLHPGCGRPHEAHDLGRRHRAAVHAAAVRLPLAGGAPAPPVVVRARGDRTGAGVRVRVDGAPHPALQPAAQHREPAHARRFAPQPRPRAAGELAAALGRSQRLPHDPGGHPGMPRRRHRRAPAPRRRSDPGSLDAGGHGLGAVAAL